MASDWLTEGLLELAFYRPVLDAIEAVYGRTVVRVMKPSPRDECLLGFDQGFFVAHGDMNTTETQARVQQVASGAVRDLPGVYVAYLLQFKRVRTMVGGAAIRPPNFALPFHRSALDLEERSGGQLPQHHVLCNLARHSRLLVSYACPMVFSQSELFRAGTDALRIVSVDAATPRYGVGERHFIAFQRPASEPVWMSEPTSAGSSDLARWARSLHDVFGAPATLADLGEVVGSERSDHRLRQRLPTGFTLVELSVDTAPTTPAVRGR